MAKAKEIINLDCSAEAFEGAAEVLRVRFKEISDLREAALDFSDIEGVHSMRVATRRLRSALRDFAPLSKKQFPKKLRKNLKRVADALGAVRDQDVAIDFLEKLQSEADTDSIKTGIEKFIKERSQLRDSARLELIEAVALDKINDLEQRFSDALEKNARRRKSKQTISFNEAGRTAITDGLENLLDLGDHLYHPFNVEELHEMRIAAKRLRYAIELFVSCWGETIAPFADEIAEMQSFLGETHDCDVWIESLSKRLETDAANRETEYQTAVWLLSEFIKKRTKEYRAALKLWSDWQTNQFAEKMQTVIESAKN